TPQGGSVWVSLRQQQDTFEICVRDSGRGIDPRFLPHVFEAFRQEESGHTRSRSGLGLGLAIAKQLVELHGGRIEAHSEGLGSGATFTVQLPQLAASRPAEPQALRELKPPREHAQFSPSNALQGYRVLVVDDDDDARKLVTALLEECGAQVWCANDATEGLQTFLRERPDLLLSDIGMPGRDGYEFMREIRALGALTPAAALTAFARAEDRRRALDAGYSAHITKPIDPAELLSVVTTLLQQRPRDFTPT
ncbi:MAG TPA: hybrid sensor histidine kinase/response regulator, partial [Polyangiales bacterium]|nr:hybrid sensor histidine kinase/response regulator [Polyangiales bacterium]